LLREDVIKGPDNPKLPLSASHDETGTRLLFKLRP
jgi:hypothetical protein